MDRITLGWSTQWDQSLDQRARQHAVRITAKHKSMYQALTANGEPINCHLSGKMLHTCSGQDQLPAVGDWCITGDHFIDETNSPAAIVERLLPRYSKVARRGVELSDEQILAANVDFVFIVCAANRDFNINRIRRYLLLADRGACQPIIVLSKHDLAGGDPVFVDELARAFPHVPSIATSIVYDSGFQAIKRCLASGQTGVFVGSSGVGKSTLINKLVESDMRATGKTRADEKGRHTTSGAAMFFIEEGGMIIDTPGLREVGLVGDTGQLDTSMPTVKELARSCRFSDCSHTSEPGCAVQDAIATGGLEETEYGTYRKLARELAYTERKNDRRLAALERKRWKQIEMNNRRASRERGG